MRRGAGREAEASRLTGPFGISAAVHLLALAALVLVRPEAPPPRPPVSRVNILAAPPGPRQIGVVRPPDATPEPPAPTPEPATPAPTPPAPAAPPTVKAPPRQPTVATKTVPPPRRQPTRATPTEGGSSGTPTPPSEAPRAGGGPTGGRGTDVATVVTAGIEFPYPGYLNNIVRQIALNFAAPQGSVLRAEVAFTIRRDGSVADVRVTRGSGDYEFDLEARGAVEAAAPRFGPLPTGFADDALPVVFSFDPRVLR